MQKPKEIILATKLYIISWVVGFITIGLEYFDIIPNALTHAEWKNSFMSIAIGLLIAVFLFIFVAKGKNWARILFLIFFVIGALPVFFSLPLILKISLVTGLISIGQTMLQAYVIYLLFSKGGKVWFKKSNQQKEDEIQVR